MTEQFRRDLQAELVAVRSRPGEIEATKSYSRVAGKSGRHHGFSKRLVFGLVPLFGCLVLMGGTASADDALLINPQGLVGIGTPGPGEKLHVSKGKIQLDGDQQIKFTDTDTTNNLKLQLWSGYGLGINGGTLFYAANGRHSWRDQNGTTEWMALTTGKNGGLTVMGTGTSSFAGRIKDKTGDVMPVGSIIAYAGKAAPEGWLFCNGALIPEGEKYGELRVVLGVDTIPDLRGRTLVQAGQGSGLTPRELGQQGGEEKHTLTEDEMAKHHHFGWGEAVENNWNEDESTTKLKRRGNGKQDFTGSRSTDADNYLYASTETGKSTPFNVMQPYHVVNYIIKY